MGHSHKLFNYTSAESILFCHVSSYNTRSPFDMDCFLSVQFLCNEVSFAVAIDHLQETTEKGVVVLELYSGCGHHGDIISTVLKDTLCDSDGHRPHITLLRVDNRVAGIGNPEIVADITTATSADMHKLRLIYPNKLWIVIASPPCEAYSKANTTGDTSEEALALADAKVLQVQNFIENLEATLGVLENPATGRLKSRNVRNIVELTSVFITHASTSTQYRTISFKRELLQ